MTKNVDGNNTCSRTVGLITEFERTCDHDSTEIGQQFGKLQRFMIENKDILSCNEGIKPINRLKNRYKDVLPYDKSRVILKCENDSDYINASFIEDFNGYHRYIAAQGPIDESINDFIRMIWDFQITSIICTANDVEAGRFKFRRYWPNNEESCQFGLYHIAKDQSSDKSYSCNDYEICPLVITREETQRHVLLYHFLHWPDHDTPNDEAPILDLLLRLYKNRDSSIDSPILVHCSAGCGRTGSIIAIDLCRLFLNDEHLFSNQDYQPYPVFKIASHIRQFRIALIQTLKQYFFVYKMFLFMMKANGNISLYSTENNDENQTFSSLATKLAPPSTISSSSRRPSAPLQIVLRNPPIRRRLLYGSSISNTPSPTISPSEIFSRSSKSSSLNDTPQTPEPPCSSHLNTKNKQNQTSDTIKCNINRSRSLRRKKLINNRSNSSDVHSILCSRSYQSHVSNEQEINSD
ncbi:unnamed protein product [Adineta steineri]|uniref:protein-tyrosine-phosphatase n=1 Tax=Adineta steineri TaxID=433720 RepID=A0A818P430_9BILA|nr:unnamed protein product [Adineta steineri]